MRAPSGSLAYLGPPEVRSPSTGPARVTLSRIEPVPWRRVPEVDAFVSGLVGRHRRAAARRCPKTDTAPCRCQAPSPRQGLPERQKHRGQRMSRDHRACSPTHARARDARMRYPAPKPVFAGFFAREVTLRVPIAGAHTRASCAGAYTRPPTGGFRHGCMVERQLARLTQKVRKGEDPLTVTTHTGGSPTVSLHSPLKCPCEYTARSIV